MADNDKIVDFEDLFKNEREKRLQNIVDPERKNSYMYSILAYFLVMFIVSSILFILFFGFSSFQETLTEEEALIETLIYDIDGIVFLDVPFDTPEAYVLMVGIYEGYDVYINALNTGTDILLDDDNQLMTDVMTQMLNQEINAWSNARDITIYKGLTQTFSFETSVEFTDDTIVSETTKLSGLGLNVLNFSTYMILLPVMLIFLKVDLIKDYKSFIGLKSQWLSLIVTGYLFVILGNLVSNGLSQFLSLLLGVEMQQAVNQITIVRSLNSPGMPLMLISAVILGPVVEELVFRKAMFGLISNVKIAMVVSSLTFGAIHLIGEASLTQALINGMSYFVMGFVFGYIYLRSHKNIWIPIIVHVISNLIAIVAIMFLPV
ncbi:MAG: lysostaphin resistance A-like protein [Acholeplasmataceae bacterium]